MNYLESLNLDLWTTDIIKAKGIQRVLRENIKIIPLDKPPSLIAAVDAAFYDDYVIAVATFYKYPKLINLEDTYEVEKTAFPYVPGFLCFREGPTILKALAKSKLIPDLIIFDGQGIAHPRGIGIASQIGVILNIPTIGCAKSKLIGEYKEPPIEKGGYEPLTYKGQKIGIALRSRTGKKPIFISPGHLIDYESSLQIIMSCITNYRIPEPLRRADQLSKKLINKIFSKD